MAEQRTLLASANRLLFWTKFRSLREPPHPFPDAAVLVLVIVATACTHYFNNDYFGKL
jgi:hypothetical protein